MKIRNEKQLELLYDYSYRRFKYAIGIKHLNFWWDIINLISIQWNIYGYEDT